MMIEASLIQDTVEWIDLLSCGISDADGGRLGPMAVDVATATTVVDQVSVAGRSTLRRIRSSRSLATDHGQLASIVATPSASQSSSIVETEVDSVARAAPRDLER